MPIAIIIALVLPGNQIIPLGDLPNLISVMAVIVIVCESNVFRGIILGIPIIIAYLLIATEFASLFTNLSRQYGLDYTNEYSGNISAFTDGGNPIRYWFYYIFNGNFIAILVIPIVIILFFITWKKHKLLISSENQNILNTDAPWILTDSIISSGTEYKICLIKKIPNAVKDSGINKPK